MISNPALADGARPKQAHTAGSPARPERAIIMGASMAGLSAARILANYFDEVVLVERDQLGGVGEHRRGVPQARHSHGLLASGLNTLNGLFPGMIQEAIDAGALPIDVMRDAHLCIGGGEHLRFESGFEGLLISRPLLEGLVRERVRSIANIRLRDGCQVQGLTATSDNNRVTGVRVNGDVLPAALVVDATGRGSRSPVWLEGMGYGRPKEERIEIDIAYATRRFRRYPDHLNGALAAVIPPTSEDKRGGVMIAQENGAWIVSLNAYCGGSVPTELSAFVDYAKTIPAPYIYDVVSQAEPIGDAETFRFRASTRRRYESMSRFPEGYLVIGDAICCFNPAYGQGMSVAVLEALELDKTVRMSSAGLARRFFRQVAKLVDTPWTIAAAGDLRFPEVPGRRTALSCLRNWYLARLHVGARHDPRLASAFQMVSSLLEPPQSLLRPSVIGRVLWSAYCRPPLHPRTRPDKLVTTVLEESRGDRLRAQ